MTGVPDIDAVNATARSSDPPPAAAYHSGYRTVGFRWWKPLVALALFSALWGVGVLVPSLIAVAYELAGGASLEDLTEGLNTPSFFLANNVGVALAIPAAMVTHRVVFGQRMGWLFSVLGRFRWRLLLRLLVVAASVHLVLLTAWLSINGLPGPLRIHPETWFLLAVVLLTTPLQAAGEEVSLRGLATRAIGSWFDKPVVGLVVSTAVTAGLFVLLHSAGDLGLNAFYLALALSASLLTWRTGGLEAAIALHVVVNLTTMLFLPFLGLDSAFDRGAGAGGGQAWAQLIAVVLAATAILWSWATRRAS